MGQQQLAFFENQLRFLTQLGDIRSKQLPLLTDPEHRKTVEGDLEQLKSRLIRGDCKVSQQELLQFSLEILRLGFLCDFLDIQSKFRDGVGLKPAAQVPYGRVKELMTGLEPFTVQRENELKVSFKRLSELQGGLGISDRERQEIVTAMALGQGHWYKCPNGHIYAIGDCGGANQESTCNECGARIGGGSHRLVDGNDHTGEMDGSTRAAWPPR